MSRAAISRRAAAIAAGLLGAALAGVRLALTALGDVITGSYALPASSIGAGVLLAVSLMLVLIAAAGARPSSSGAVMLLTIIGVVIGLIDLLVLVVEGLVVPAAQSQLGVWFMPALQLVILLLTSFQLRRAISDRRNEAR
ncbi:hypothetical protein [Microbacterium sediminis]|uniref:Uncharacterized protein n=1 Tax=Microbacterium sediminis TaxID=904291 RepID=A0A1B9NE04_9MICO|nr:hypothetical protein [Microbacterium sediminis]OCG74810.1 hypothetical protein A7J15_04645 [Microbacterium sediminis]QBR75111.1 hypothetical protein E3O41_12375 [Microbacterium sediminis]